MDVDIERAAADDGPSILQLLREADLPVDGVLDHLDTAFVARVGGRIVGCAALEVYEEGALLRSVGVAPPVQGRGVGRRLTEAAITLAQSVGVPAVYLLTTTAERYFPKLGFLPITRAEVPASVHASVEFRSACPASAVVMRRVLRHIHEREARRAVRKTPGASAPHERERPKNKT